MNNNINNIEKIQFKAQRDNVEEDRENFANINAVEYAGNLKRAVKLLSPLEKEALSKIKSIIIGTKTDRIDRNPDPFEATIDYKVKKPVPIAGELRKIIGQFFVVWTPKEKNNFDSKTLRCEDSLGESKTFYTSTDYIVDSPEKYSPQEGDYKVIMMETTRMISEQVRDEWVFKETYDEDEDRILQPRKETKIESIFKYRNKKWLQIIGRTEKEDQKFDDPLKLNDETESKEGWWQHNYSDWYDGL